MIIISLLLSITPLSLYINQEIENKKYMQDIYGKNKKIKGEYNSNLSIRCRNGIFK